MNATPWLTWGADTITDEDRDKSLQSLQDFSEQFSKASAPLRMALELASGK